MKNALFKRTCGSWFYIKDSESMVYIRINKDRTEYNQLNHMSNEISYYIKLRYKNSGTQHINYSLIESNIDSKYEVLLFSKDPTSREMGMRILLNDLNIKI